MLPYYEERDTKGFLGKIDLNGKVFLSIENTDNGEVSDETIFQYYQQGDIIWATYVGGKINKGFLVGKFVEDNQVQFTYQHIDQSKEIRIGECRSEIEILSDGRLRLNESWQWLDKDRSKGRSVVEERKQM